ncbi:MAG: tRNA-dihydrouridine synthase family protein [Thermovirgaceae bacterium]|nr:tRNA-dihydrouridine synthase family protein [Thermovirgaceae bacterium]
MGEINITFPASSFPRRIGGVTVENPVWLAPLAGITVPSVRLFFRTLGAGLAHTEMISCAGLLHGSKKTLAMLRILDGERPVVLQLFAGDERTLLEGALIAASSSAFDAVGINMACPMPKVLKKGAGSRLLDRPEVAGAMVRSLAAAGLPVWVKTRKMPENSPIGTLAFTEMLLEAGASHVCIHGRSPRQRYGGDSDRSVILSVASAFPGMIAASGDVYSPDDVYDLLVGGCSAVFVARGSFRDPFLVPAALHRCGFPVDKSLLGADPGRRIEKLLLLGDGLAAEEGERIALLLLKRFLSGIFRGLCGASQFRRTIALATTWESMRATLVDWKVFAERGEQCD